jgi:hypothetical protein
VNIDQKEGVQIVTIAQKSGIEIQMVEKLAFG